MVLVKRRIYNVGFEPTASVFPLTPAPGAVVLNHQAPHSHFDTFLRGRAEVELGFAVGTPLSDIPPEQWWTRTSIIASLFWSPTGTTTVQALSGTSEHYLGSTLLKPTLVASPSAPTSYYVRFLQDDALVAQTGRKNTTDVGNPRVNLQISAEDPDFMLSGGYTGTNCAWFAKLFTVWGSTS